MHIINGSVEIAPNIGLADAIVDIVSTGGTLFKNNLEEKEVLLTSEAVLAVSPKIETTQTELLKKIKFRIQSVLKGRSSKYVLLNAPNNSLENIIKILPGMKSPTVLPLAKSGWSSVHSVINQHQFWDIIDDLKHNGAEGILICPIEKNGTLMEIIKNPKPEEWDVILKRPTQNSEALNEVVNDVFGGSSKQRR